MSELLLSGIAAGLSVNAQQSDGLAELASGWSQVEPEEFAGNTDTVSDLDSNIWI